MKIAQYPRNADGSAMDLEVGVLTDATGNNGARLLNQPVGPDSAPIDAKAMILLDAAGNWVPVSQATILSVGLFSTLATISVPAGSDIVRTSGYGANGVGSAEYIYDATVDAAFVAANPRTAFIGVNGRGFKLSLAQQHFVEMFGAVGDYNGKQVGDPLFAGTNDGPAFVAAIAWSKANAMNLSSNGFYKVGPDIYMRSPAYWLNNSVLDLTHTLGLRGTRGSGKSSIVAQVRLKWADGTDCIRTQRYNTSGEAVTDGATHFGGDGCLIENITISGTYTGVESNHAAIRLRSRAIIRNVSIDEHSGDGIFSDADDAGVGNAGNSDGTHLDTVSITGCRDAINVTGGNSNAWMCTDVETAGNRRWGLNMSGFLASIFLGGQDADNGLINGVPPSVVSNGGNRYAVVYGREATASVNAPVGTADTADWYYMQAGGVDLALNIQAWVNGMTLRAGGAARYDNANAPTVVLGRYTEGGQGPVQGSGALIIGGTQGAQVKGINANAYMRPLTAGAFFGAVGAAVDSNNFTRLIPTGLEFARSGTGDDITWELFGDSLALTVLRSANPSVWAWEFLCEGTTNDVGKRKINFPNGFGISSKKISAGPAIPVAGTFVQGDIKLNTAPSAGGALFWYCTSGGTPGTWIAMTASSGTNTGDQTITLTGDVSGSGTGSFATISKTRTLTSTFADVQNGTTVETDIFSFNTAAGELAANGDRIEAQYAGVFVSSATATRQLKVKFAGTTIFDSGALTLSLSSAWDVYVTIVRVSAAVIRYAISMTTQGAALAAYTASGELTGLTLANANILKLTAQAAGAGAATGDITGKMSSVDKKAA